MARALASVPTALDRHRSPALRSGLPEERAAEPTPAFRDAEPTSPFLEDWAASLERSTRETAQDNSAFLAVQMVGLINRPEWALTRPRADGKRRRHGEWTLGLGWMGARVAECSPAVPTV